MVCGNVIPFYAGGLRLSIAQEGANSLHACVLMRVHRAVLTTCARKGSSSGHLSGQSVRAIREIKAISCADTLKAKSAFFQSARQIPVKNKIKKTS